VDIVNSLHVLSKLNTMNIIKGLVLEI